MKVARSGGIAEVFRDSEAVRGSVSVLFMVMVLPLLFALCALTIDLTHYFGIRDELQRVIDREAHDALVHGKTSQQVQDSIRARMGNLAGMAQITSVQATRTRGRNVILVDGRYQGAFVEVAQRLYGRQSQVLSFAARAEVSIQSSAALIILDRSGVAAGSECTDPGLQAMSLFADRLAESWVQTAGTVVSVGVSPGNTRAIELLSPRSLDGIPRCRARTPGSYVDVSAIRGSTGPVPVSVISWAYRTQELVASHLVVQPVQVRSVVLVMRRATYNRGYSSTAYSFVRNLVNTTYHPIDFFVLVLDDADFVDSRPFVAGINGGAFREVTASSADFRNVRLLSATTQTITDRIVIER